MMHSKTVKRNSPCPCGSGKKYKRCCLQKPSPSQPEPTTAATISSGWAPMLAGAALILIAGIAVYWNSLQGGFVFDDRSAILENLEIRSLKPLWPIFSKTMRPLMEISLAINYAVSGYKVWSYHAVNLIIHLLAGLTLFGLIRNTLATTNLREQFASRANTLAIAITLIWIVHPLNTQSVTYIIQRAESMMGLFFLFTLYALVRSTNSLTPTIWYALGVGACILGMASKPIMVTAPLIVLLYDRTFLENSIGRALQKRRGFYIGLTVSWLVLAWFIQLPPPPEETTAGFGLSIITPLEYVRTQPLIILHYLKLAIWPSPLIIDYDWRVANTFIQIVPPTMLILSLLAATAWMVKQRKAAGFLGAFFFIILFPTSSFIPIADLAFEYRMYLPLIAVISLAVIGIDKILLIIIARDSGFRKTLAIVALAILLAGYGITTIRRNRDYQGELSIWQDTAMKRPMNARAQNNFGYALAQDDQNELALKHLLIAHQLQPNNPEVHNNLGLTLVRLKRHKEAISHYERALDIDANYAHAYSNYGLLLVKLGRADEAILKYKKAIEFRPQFVVAINNLGNAYIHLGRNEEAIPEYKKAIELNPYYTEAYQNLGIALTHLNRFDEAVRYYERAIQMKPDYADAHSNLGVVFSRMGRVQEAVQHFKTATRIDPFQQQAKTNLQTILTEHPELRNMVNP